MTPKNPSKLHRKRCYQCNQLLHVIDGSIERHNRPSAPFKECLVPDVLRRAAPGAFKAPQREVIDHLSKCLAFSCEKARSVPGFDEAHAEKLVQRGVLNKRYINTYGAAYWIRGESEVPTGTSVPAGFVVILHSDVTTPSGKTENFFLARALYDGKRTTFQRLLRGWMTVLGLRNKDLLNSSMGFELIAADATVFNGDHLILESAISPAGPV